MRILGFIPARGGSKGVPGKNIKLLNGKPLIAYTINAAANSNLLTRTIVSTDSDEIANVSKQFNADVPFMRPAELAEDATPTLPVVMHAIEQLEAQGEYYDAVCLLQATSPLRTSQNIDEAINKFIKAGTDSLISVVEVPHEYNPHWVFEVNNEDNLEIATGDASIITRRQELPKAYIRDGVIYLTKVDTIKNNSLYGNSISYITMPKETYLNIDTLEDWAKAEKLF